MSAEINPKYTHEQLLNALEKNDALHIFSSASAFACFLQVWEKLPETSKNSLPAKTMFACGVGSTTDSLVKNVTKQGPRMVWSFPDLTAQGQRENGLNWTLEALEKKGFVPKHALNLWCKTWSTSEKILSSYRSSRGWTAWETHVHEVYSVQLNKNPIPQDIVIALAKKEPICFGVRSADVLDATLTLLVEHLGKTSVAELPKNIHLSVWEKSALARAQQLFLQSRLIPAPEFESLLRNGGGAP